MKRILKQISLISLIFISCNYVSKKTTYSNGNSFKVVSFIYTDLNDKVVDKQDDIKKTTFIINDKEKFFSVVMGDVYYERYYYDKPNRLTIGKGIRDVYSIYKSYNSQNVNKSLTDVLLLDVDENNELKSYKLYFQDKGFITFQLIPL